MRSQKFVFYYDGSCQFCSHIAMWLQRVDFRNKIHWVPFQHLSQPPNGLSWRDLRAASYLEISPSDLRPGFEALKCLVTKLPLLFPMIPFIWVLDKFGAGPAMYSWVAQRRGLCYQCCTQDHRDP